LNEVFLHQHYKFIPEAVVVNKEKYKDVLVCLYMAIHVQQSEMWAAKDCMLLHDNSQTHKSFLVQQQLAKHNNVVHPNPLYSSNIVPCNFYFYLFLWMRGCHFKNVVEVQVELKIPLQVVIRGSLQKYFKQLYMHW
jgi:hypothetical protein